MPGDKKNSVAKWIVDLVLQRSGQRIKFGGVIGKVAYFAAAAVVAAAIIMWSSTNELLKAGAVFAVLIFALIVVTKLLAHADKYPYVSMLEGTELLAFSQQVLGAKGMVVPTDPPKLEAGPLTPPPGIDEGGKK